MVDLCVIEDAKYCKKQYVVNCMALLACMPVMVMLLMLVGRGMKKQNGDKIEGEEDEEDEDDEDDEVEEC